MRVLALQPASGSQEHAYGRYFWPREKFKREIGVSLYGAMKKKEGQLSDGAGQGAPSADQIEMRKMMSGQQRA